MVVRIVTAGWTVPLAEVQKLTSVGVTGPVFSQLPGKESEMRVEWGGYAVDKDVSSLDVWFQVSGPTNLIGGVGLVVAGAVTVTTLGLVFAAAAIVGGVAAYLAERSDDEVRWAYQNKAIFQCVQIDGTYDVIAAVADRTENCEFHDGAGNKFGYATTLYQEQHYNSGSQTVIVRETVYVKPSNSDLAELSHLPWPRFSELSGELSCFEKSENIARAM